MCLLSQFVGKRLRESRLIASMSQKDAADELGYSNSSKLNKIENGMSSQVPLWVIAKACVLYDVSADYLFGITSTMERDGVDHAALRELHAFLFAEFDKRHAKDILVLEHIQGKIVEIQDLLKLAHMQSEELTKEMDRVSELSEWQDVRGGNRLANAIDRMCNTLSSAKRTFTRTQQDIKIKGGRDYQLDLALDL